MRKRKFTRNWKTSFVAFVPPGLNLELSLLVKNGYSVGVSTIFTCAHYFML